MRFPTSRPLRIGPVLVLVIAVLGDRARGQAIEMPERAPLPKTFQRTPTRDACEPDPDPGDPPPPPWRIMVAVKHVLPLSRPALDAKPPLGAREFQYLEPSHVLAVSQPMGRGAGKDSHEFLLLGQIAEDGETLSKPLGWVPRDFVIESPKALVADNCIPIKAMIINDPRRGETLMDEKGEFQRAVWTLSVPAEPRNDRERADYRLAQYNLFNIFWVYARTPAGRVTPEGQSIKGSPYLLLGAAPSFTVDPKANRDNASEVIIGWVPESRVVPWSTREGIAWDQASTLPGANPRRTNPGVVFQTAEDAWAAFYPAEFNQYFNRSAPARIAKPMSETFVPYKDYLKSVEESSGKARRPAADRPVEAGVQVSLGYEPHHMRFPWLKPDRRSGSVELKQPTSNTRTGNELYRIGAIGGTEGLSDKQIADRSRQLERIGTLLATTEILFVIDDTVSMQKHFNDVADAVQTILDDARANAAKIGQGGLAAPIKLAVAYYNDIDETDPKHVPCQPMKLEPVELLGQDFVRKVREHGEFAGGGLPREMVFNGLQQAISGAFFSTYARKLVILIGDMGDKGSKSDPEADNLVRETARLFRSETDAPYEFISIQVVPPGQGDDARAFATQMAKLARFLNESRVSSKRTLGTNLVLGRDDLAQTISRGYEGIRADAKRMGDQVEALRMGKLATKLDDDFINIIRKEVPNSEKLLKPKPGQAELDLQGFNVGYIWRYPLGQEAQVSQTREVVLLNRGEIRDLVNALKPIATFRARNDRRKQPTKEAIRELIVALAGEGGGYDLQLAGWGDGAAAPTSGRDLVVVGTDNRGLLHIRIFNSDGKQETDQVETRLPDQAAAIASLKQRLPDLSPPHALTQAEKSLVVREATMIVGKPGHAKDPEASFERATMMRLGLQVRSEFLKHSLSRGTVNLNWQEIEDLSCKIERLQDILNGKEHEWTTRTVKEDQGEFTFHLKGAAIYDRPRGFTIPPTTTQWYWLDVLDEVP